MLPNLYIQILEQGDRKSTDSRLLELENLR